MKPYEPQDRMFLWCLAQTQAPVMVGTLQMVRAQRGESLRYHEGWLRQCFALSEDLPLVDGEFLPQ